MSDTKIVRCPWCGNDELYMEYHDKEWDNKLPTSTSFLNF